MRWKYKLYPADEIENAALNNYVFCQIKEDRLVGSFAVTPPVEGRYYFKVRDCLIIFSNLINFHKNLYFLLFQINPQFLRLKIYLNFEFT